MEIFSIKKNGKSRVRASLLSATMNLVAGALVFVAKTIVGEQSKTLAGDELLTAQIGSQPVFGIFGADVRGAYDLYVGGLKDPKTAVPMWVNKKGEKSPDSDAEAFINSKLLFSVEHGTLKVAV